MADNEFLRENFQPVLLGDTPLSRRLARELYKKHRLISYVCDKRCSLLTRLLPCCRFWRISGTEFSELAAKQLCRLAFVDAFCVYIAIPCSAEYETLIKENNTVLDAAFVIRHPSDPLDKLFAEE